ncbi:MAG: Fe-S protein assembly co-chaperone HscB [Phycisphaerales bacterium]
MSPPASDDDPFALLGLPRRFSIDESRLRAARTRLLAAAHPDRAGGDAGATADAARRSAAINDAFRAISAPVARAETLLRLLGAPSRASEPQSPAFLMEMMELRESLDAAIDADDRERIAAMRDDAAARRADLVSELASALDGAADGGAADLAAARDALGRLRAVERVVARAATALASGE